MADCIYPYKVTPLIFSLSTHKTAASATAHLVIYIDTHVHGHKIKNKCVICALCKYEYSQSLNTHKHPSTHAEQYSSLLSADGTSAAQMCTVLRCC